MRDMEGKQQPHAALIARGFRLQLACGLCFALLLLLGLSGVASITLLYEDPMFTRSATGLEGETVRFLVSIKGWISALHEWGGYVAIVLAGWAGLEVFGFGRQLKRSSNKGWQKTGRWMPATGLAASAIVVVALLMLLASGIAASAFLHDGEKDAKQVPLQAVERFQGISDARSEIAAQGSEQTVEWHTREFNYLLAFGALLLVAAASSARNITREAKSEQAEAAKT